MYRPQGSGTQQHQIAVQSWYPPPSAAGPPGAGAQAASSPRLSNGGASGSASFPRVSSSGGMNGESRPHSPAGNSSQRQGHPATGGTTLGSLKELSVRDLENLLKNKEAYHAFLHCLEHVRHTESLVQDLRTSNVEQAKKNVAKEADIAELKNQCAIIRTTELAAARERFDEAQAKEREVFNLLSPAALANKMQEAASEADEESENLHRKFVQGDMELGDFIPTYRNERLKYHKRSLTKLAVLSAPSRSW